MAARQILPPASPPRPEAPRRAARGAPAGRRQARRRAPHPVLRSGSPGSLREPEGLGQVVGHDRRPSPGPDVTEQDDHRVRFKRRVNGHAGLRQMLVDDPPVLHVGCQEAERQLRHLGPRHARRVGVRIAGRSDQPIALGIERNGNDVPERFVVEIGDPGIDVEIAEQRQNLDRGPRQDRERDAGGGDRETASSGAAPSQGPSESPRAEAGPTDPIVPPASRPSSCAHHRRSVAPRRGPARPPASAPGTASRAARA